MGKMEYDMLEALQKIASELEIMNTRQLLVDIKKSENDLLNPWIRKQLEERGLNEQ